ncbi:ComEA family DNA-binding protein [Porphyromonas asaccharolytica]
MNSFKRGRTETWVLIAVSLIILAAIGKVLWDNNYQAQSLAPLAGQTISEQIVSLPTDSIQRRASGTYAPPLQPDKSQKDVRGASQGVELSADYVGAPEQQKYSSQPKLREGQRIDLNSADTLTLQQVPGIGPSFARRIVKYRDQLGGYYTVLQLQEIYGMEPDRYQRIKPFFYIGVRNYSTPFDALRSDSIPSHPYLNYRQQAALARSIRKNGTIDSWHRIMSLEEFNRDDSVRLSHYFHFK